MKKYPSLLIRQDINDKELANIIDKVKKYDENALSQLAKYIYARIYGYIYYRVNHREDTEDLTSEVVLKAIQALNRQHGNFNAWIYKIARNAIIDFYRRRGVRSEISLSEIPGEIADDSIPVSEIIMKKERLRKGLQILTEEQKQVIVLKFIEGYTNPEIAKIVGKSVGAVKLLQFRALKSLNNFFRKKNHERKN